MTEWHNITWSASGPSADPVEPPETGAEAEARAADDIARSAEGEAAYYAYCARVARTEADAATAARDTGREAGVEPEAGQ